MARRGAATAAAPTLPGRRHGRCPAPAEALGVAVLAGDGRGDLGVFGYRFLNHRGGAAHGDHVGLELREQTHQHHLQGGGNGNGQQRAANAEQRAAGHQCDQRQQRMQIDAAADHTRGDNVVKHNLMNEDHHKTMMIANVPPCVASVTSPIKIVDTSAPK